MRGKHCTIFSQVNSLLQLFSHRNSYSANNLGSHFTRLDCSYIILSKWVCCRSKMPISVILTTCNMCCCHHAICDYGLFAMFASCRVYEWQQCFYIVTSWLLYDYGLIMISCNDLCRCFGRNYTDYKIAHNRFQMKKTTQHLGQCKLRKSVHLDRKRIRVDVKLWNVYLLINKFTIFYNARHV